MGCCVSTNSEATSQGRPTAKVITLSGNLEEYYSSMKSSLVVGDTSDQSQPSTFICNSNDLSYDQPIPPLHPDDPIVPGEIYFILPYEKYKKPVSASEMAAMAVKCTVAMQRAAEEGKGKGNGKIRGVMPVFEVAEDDDCGGSDENEFASDAKKMAELQASDWAADTVERSSTGSKLSIILEEEENEQEGGGKKA